jgi:two-component system, cell cycle response regulator
MNPTFDELKLTGNLPSPSGVGLQILQLTQNEDFSAEELAQTIQSDPALTGRLIKMSNSALLSGVKEVATVGEAVVRLGVAAVRNVSLGFSLVSSYRSGKCQAFEFSRFWSESLARAIVAQSIARETKLAPPAEVYICGLLASIGKLALATVHPQAYAELLAAHPNSDDDKIAVAETERFGIQHREVAAAMLTDWRLPEAHRTAILTLAQRASGDPRSGDLSGKLRRSLRLAFPISQIFLTNVKDVAPLFRRLEVVRNEAADLDVETMFRIADTAAREWQEWGKMLSLPTQKVNPFKELAEAARQMGQGPAPAAPAEVALPGSNSTTISRATAAPKLPLAEAAIESIFERWKNEEIRREDLVILCADDDPITRRILSTHLKRVGYQVIEAKDGKEALTKALEHNPHIVITDWQMPEIDGVTVCSRLRDTEIGRKMYVLVLTGVDDEAHVIQAFEAGADDYISKPVNPPVLLARVTAGERLARLQDRVEKDHQRMRDQLAQMAILNRKLRLTSVTDSLTNLPNRRFAMKFLEEIFARPAASDRCCVIGIDIDHFKRINDGFGHDVGDAVLREVGTVIARNIRGTDRVCRIGGEEFLVICPGSDIPTAQKIAERLRIAVADHRTKFGKFAETVTVSVGIAQRGDAMSHFDDMLKCADEALYESKHKGRNRVTVFAGV